MHQLGYRFPGFTPADDLGPVPQHRAHLAPHDRPPSPRRARQGGSAMRTTDPLPARH
ncbi:hypothetical protein ACH4SP_04990 [Streptomyces sp. NPDC021093]|uniref:hypothetical protein n=1 Tax=Streptomyces sp. NPDC021093 TaxID=3365112 RepID=UPI00379700CB